MSAQRAGGRQPSEALAFAIESGLQLDALSQASGAGLAGQFQGLNGEVRPRRIAVDHEGRETLAEQTGALAGHLAAVAVVEDRRQRHRGWKAARRTDEAVDRRVDTGIVIGGGMAQRAGAEVNVP